MRPRKAPAPTLEPVSASEVERLRAGVIYYEDWLSLDDEPPQYWAGASTVTRLAALATDRVMNATGRAWAAGEVGTEDYRRLRDLQCGNGGAWGPRGEDFLRRWHERRWPSPEEAA